MNVNDFKEQLKGKRIAAIDYGTKRIGVAVCDELHISVNPIKTIHTENTNLADEIKNIFSAERIEAVVVGMPETLNGKENVIISKIKSFGNYIKNEFQLDVFYIDEAFSSKHAGGYMIDYGIKKKSRAKKGMLDKYAAVIILQQFLSELE
jgi:putative Holliday junction resolvase